MCSMVAVLRIDILRGTVFGSDVTQCDVLPDSETYRKYDGDQ